MTDEHHDPAPDSERRLEEILAEHREPASPDPQDEDGSTDPPADPHGLAGIAEIERIGDDAAATATHGDSDRGGADGDADHADADEDRLPDAPLFALLRTIEGEIGVDRIDRIWIFPPRKLQAGETSVVVVAAFPEVDDDRRRVYAAHYTAHDEARQPRLALDEYGTAPTDRVGRLVEEVVERIKDGPADAPRSHAITGQTTRWHAVLHQLAETFLADSRRNPRLRP